MSTKTYFFLHVRYVCQEVALWQRSAPTRFVSRTIFSALVVTGWSWRRWRDLSFAGGIRCVLFFPNLASGGVWAPQTTTPVGFWCRIIQLVVERRACFSRRCLNPPFSPSHLPMLRAGCEKLGVLLWHSRSLLTRTDTHPGKVFRRFTSWLFCRPLCLPPRPEQNVSAVSCVTLHPAAASEAVGGTRRRSGQLVETAAAAKVAVGSFCGPKKLVWQTRWNTKCVETHRMSYALIPAGKVWTGTPVALRLGIEILTLNSVFFLFAHISTNPRSQLFTAASVSQFSFVLLMPSTVTVANVVPPTDASKMCTFRKLVSFRRFSWLCERESFSDAAVIKPFQLFEVEFKLKVTQKSRVFTQIIPTWTLYFLKFIYIV